MQRCVVKRCLSRSMVVLDRRHRGSHALPICFMPKFGITNSSANNDLPRMNAAHRASVLSLNPIRLSDKNHDVLMDAASLREGLDYEENIPFNTLESSNDDEETDDKEQEYSEISEDEDKE